jgi:glutamate-1-semialdehyde 2,1-aminomutase
MKHEKSGELFERSLKVMPGGNTRSVTHYEPFPVAIDRGAGCRLWDVDGNEYIDLLNNYTPLVHGHAHPLITEAIAVTAARGTVFPAPTPVLVELAERICARTPCIDQVRFTNSGTEAVMVALRAARAFTGRDELIMPAGGFHGTWEQVALEAVEMPAEDGIVQSSSVPRGIPGKVVGMMHFVRYNDVGHLEELMAQHGEKVAAIIMEPILGHTLERGDPEFVKAAQRLASDYGALLVLDEVVTCRLHVGGWSALHDIKPDLTTLGKTIGGGLPVGAVGGSARVMEVFDARRPNAVPHHGTFNGTSLVMAAGCVSLDLLDQPAIDRINALGDQVAAAMAEAVGESGAQVRVVNVGSLLHAHSPRWRELHRACLEEGLYIAPRGSMNLSTVMGAGDVEEALAAWRRALRRVEWSA